MMSKISMQIGSFKRIVLMFPVMIFVFIFWIILLLVMAVTSFNREKCRNLFL